jgi:molybdopterin converting factor small subunit
MPTYSVRYMPVGPASSGLVTVSIPSLEQMTIGSLLDYMVKKAKLLPAGRGDGQAAEDYLILINGRSAHAMDCQDTLLADGDMVSILLPVSGG